MQYPLILYSIESTKTTIPDDYTGDNFREWCEYLKSARKISHQHTLNMEPKKKVYPDDESDEITTVTTVTTEKKDLDEDDDNDNDEELEEDEDDGA